MRFNKTVNICIEIIYLKLKSLGEIMSPKSFTVDDLQISGFDKCLMWQIEKIVPSLDIFRTSLLNEQLSGIFLDVSVRS